MKWPLVVVLLLAGCARRVQVRQIDDSRLLSGEIVAVERKTPSDSAEIQHWIAAAFVKGANLEKAIPVLENYNNRARFMGPQIRESRIVQKRGEQMTVYLRIEEKSIISAEFDVFLKIRFERKAGRLLIDSKSESITDRSGRDRGLLWALHHVWLVEERDGGLYLECEATTWSQKPPPALGFIAHPIIEQAARKTLVSTVAATRRMILEAALQ